MFPQGNCQSSEFVADNKLPEAPGCFGGDAPTSVGWREEITLLNGPVLSASASQILPLFLLFLNEKEKQKQVSFSFVCFLSYNNTKIS